MTEKEYKFSEEDIRKAYDVWARTHNSRDLLAVIEKANPIMQYALRYYVSDLPDSPVLQIRAKRLVAEAVKTYNPTKGPLTNHLMISLQRLQRLAGQERKMIKHSEQIAMLSDLLKNESQSFYAQHGREPTTEELADRTGLSMKKISRIRKLSATVIPESRFVLSNVDEESAVKEVSGKILGEESKEFSDLLQTYYLTASPTDKIIIEHGFGLFGQKQKNLTEVAKLLKVTPAAVTQRLNKIYSDLRELHVALRD